jgi:Restriction alleviation protein Lar
VNKVAMLIHALEAGTPKLLPCPFCGGANVEHLQWDLQFIYCPDCGIGSTLLYTMSKEIPEQLPTLWNRRAQSPPIPVGVLTEEQKRVARTMGVHVP